MGNKKLITKMDLLNKIALITKLAIYINAETNAHVFIGYSGHVDWFDIKFYKNGWKSECTYSDMIYTYSCNRDLPFDGDVTECNYERGIDLTMHDLEKAKRKLIELAKDKNLDISEILESEGKK